MAVTARKIISPRRHPPERTHELPYPISFDCFFGVVFRAHCVEPVTPGNPDHYLQGGYDRPALADRAMVFAGCQLGRTHSRLFHRACPPCGWLSGRFVHFGHWNRCLGQSWPFRTPDFHPDGSGRVGWRCPGNDLHRSHQGHVRSIGGRQPGTAGSRSGTGSRFVPWPDFPGPSRRLLVCAGLLDAAGSHPGLCGCGSAGPPGRVACLSQCAGGA